jgi:hypothetical protein
LSFSIIFFWPCIVLVTLTSCDIAPVDSAGIVVELGGNISSFRYFGTAAYWIVGIIHCFRYICEMKKYPPGILSSPKAPDCYSKTCTRSTTAKDLMEMAWRYPIKSA